MHVLLFSDIIVHILFINSFKFYRHTLHVFIRCLDNLHGRQRIKLFILMRLCHLIIKILLSSSNEHVIVFNIYNVKT